jgi:hypothetical protein
MSLDISNSLRSKSTIRLTGNTATRINLSQLSASVNETVTAAVISQVYTSSDGTWRVYRGNDATGQLVLELYQSVALPLTQFDIVVSSNSTSNLYCTNSGTSGTLILSLSKTASYTNDVDTGYPV